VLHGQRNECENHKKYKNELSGQNAEFLYLELDGTYKTIGLQKIHPSIHSSTVLLLDLGSFFSFLIIYTVNRTPGTGDQPVAKPLSTHRTTQTPNKRTQTSMPLVGFEPTISAFERAKTVHAFDRAATVIGQKTHMPSLNQVPAKCADN
jgi:hypothetical protein